MSNIQHSSRSDNWGTPENIINLVHSVIGHPDLDPASNTVHNQLVKANRIITKEQDGLLTKWVENAKPITVFINPPGGKKGNKSITKLFWKKLIELKEQDLLNEAIFMCFSVEALQNSQLDCKTPIGNFPICIPSKRIKFIDQTAQKRQAPAHSNAIAYIPGIVDKSNLFYEIFSSLGSVMRPYV